MCNCCEPCECETERSEVVSMINRLVGDMMWKISDMEAGKSEELMLKFFKLLGSAKDLKAIGEMLIKYEADLKIKKLSEKVKEDKIEEEEKVSEETLFDRFE